MEKTTKRPRGFAAMTPEQRAEIARKGGKSAWALGTAHKWDHEAAVRAGRKGGSTSRRRSKYSSTIKER